MKTYHIIVSGFVQGVFFRENTKKQADKLSIKGTVKNLDTGKVEIFAQGEEKNIKKFVEWCKIGSKLAKVKKLIINENEKQKYDAFEIKW